MDAEVERRLRSLAEDVIVAAPEFNEALHPRGRDGRFIETGGWVRGLFKAAGKVFRMSGKVVDIKPNPSNPDKPIVTVETKDGVLNTLATNIESSATYKASLNDVNPKPDFKPKKPPAPKKPLSVRIQESKAKLNAAAANLNTTDPQERAQELNGILSGVRGTPLSTAVQFNQLGESRDEWDLDRAARHEQLWSSFIAKVEASGVPQDREALVLGGLPGAGKSYSLRPDGVAGEFGVVAWDTMGEMPEGTNHIVLNPDVLKELMIEAGMLPDGITPELKPMEQVTFIHAESNFLVGLFFRRLSQQGYNVVYDTTMANVPHMTKNLRPLAEEGYRFKGLYVDIDYEESRLSATRRYMDSWDSEMGGRFVPAEAGAGGNNIHVFDQMKPWFEDGWMLVNNRGVSKGEPAGEIIEQGVGDGSALRRYREPSEKTTWTQEASDLFAKKKEPEDVLRAMMNDSVFVADQVDASAEAPLYETKSSLHHELYQAGRGDLATEYSQEIQRLRNMGSTIDNMMYRPATTS